MADSCLDIRPYSWVPKKPPPPPPPSLSLSRLLFFEFFPTSPQCLFELPPLVYHSKYLFTHLCRHWQYQWKHFQYQHFSNSARENVKKDPYILVLYYFGDTYCHILFLLVYIFNLTVPINTSFFDFPSPR